LADWVKFKSIFFLLTEPHRILKNALRKSARKTDGNSELNSE
jgi:hypothetical protein